MALNCPNKNLKSYKDLVRATGSDAVAHALWIQFDGVVPESFYAQKAATEPVVKVKEGVDFVFEQNPELVSIGTQEQYSQYFDTIFPESKVKEIDDSLYNSVLNQLEQENKIEKDCSDGNLKAKDGIRGKFTKGSKWEIIKDLKGYPSHTQGGVDIKLGKDGFSFTRNNGVIEAKHGLVLPKIK